MAKTKLVPLNATNLTNDIVNRLNIDGHCANRVNTAGIWDKRGFYRKLKKGEKGKSDIMVCMAPVGWYVGIEVKIGDDPTSVHQHQFKDRVLAAGGRYVKIGTQVEFLAWYKQITELIEYFHTATQYL